MTPEKVTPRRKLKPSKSLENRNFKELPEKPRKRDVDTIEQIISEIQNKCEVDKENIDQKVFYSKKSFQRNLLNFEDSNSHLNNNRS